MKLVAAGLAFSTAAALSLTRVASTLLYGVSASDGATYVAIAVLLALSALIAIVLPARRAMRVDPMEVLGR